MKKNPHLIHVCKTPMLEGWGPTKTSIHKIEVHLKFHKGPSKKDKRVQSSYWLWTRNKLNSCLRETHQEINFENWEYSTNQSWDFATFAAMSRQRNGQRGRNTASIFIEVPQPEEEQQHTHAITACKRENKISQITANWLWKNFQAGMTGLALNEIKYWQHNWVLEYADSCALIPVHELVLESEPPVNHTGSFQDESMTERQRQVWQYRAWI